MKVYNDLRLRCVGGVLAALRFWPPGAPIVLVCNDESECVLKRDKLEEIIKYDGITFKF